MTISPLAADTPVAPRRRRRWLAAGTLVGLVSVGGVVAIAATPSSITKPAAATATADRVTMPAAAPPATVPPATQSLSPGCASRPSSCGYPDATNTGAASSGLRRVPQDVRSGTGWSWDDRGWLNVSGTGAVLEALSVAAPIEVTASNVTIRNVRIEVGGETWGIALRHASNVTIDRVTIGPPAGAERLMVGIKDIYDDSNGTQILRSNIFGASTGIQMGGGLIQDSYIHDLRMKAGDHVNGITSNGSTRPLTIRHNTIFNSFDQTDAIGLFQDFGVEANRVIDGNLLAGGGYTIYGGANPGGRPTSNIQVTNNRFARLYFRSSGYYGHATAFDRSGAGNSWSGNVWDDTLAAVPAP